MKYIILIFTLLFSINSFAEYKITFSNSNASIPEKEGPWEAPSGEFALHPNGITITCLDVPSGNYPFNGEYYQVVYNKSDAVTYAGNACTSNINDLSDTFRDHVNFNENISHWDTSNVNDIRNMFRGASNFNQDISQWDISGVNSLSHVFFGASKFNQDIGQWDTSNVTNMYNTFGKAHQFNQDISSWDVSKVINMRQMFWEAYRFNQDVSNWKTGGVTDMQNMFRSAIDFNQDLSTWCVKNFLSEPAYFDTGATSWTLPKPDWGICPE